MDELRDHSQPCEHGHELAHNQITSGMPDTGESCPGGRVVTIDYEAHERMVQRFIGYLNQGGTAGTSIDEIGVLSREMVDAAIGDTAKGLLADGR